MEDGQIASGIRIVLSDPSDPSAAPAAAGGRLSMRSLWDRLVIASASPFEWRTAVRQLFCGASAQIVSTASGGAEELEPSSLRCWK
jgi:hypothetical protein